VFMGSPQAYLYQPTRSHTFHIMTGGS
jgi:hypothetical protein